MAQARLPGAHGSRHGRTASTRRRPRTPALPVVATGPVLTVKPQLASCSGSAMKQVNASAAELERWARCSPLRCVTSPHSATHSFQQGLEPLLNERWPGIQERYWEWRGHRIRYHQASSNSSRPGGTPVVLVHGFGGNADHWRKNTAALAALDGSLQVYAIDLLGYGYSDKPDPRSWPGYRGGADVPGFYSFENWSRQLTDFVEQVVGGTPTFIVCNSVGGVAGLQASIDRPELVRGVQVMNISLRGLHVKRMPKWQRPLVAWFQRLLQETDVGKAFFLGMAQPQAVKKVLRLAYAHKEAVTDELVECILRPGLQPGAVDVFLDFISNSGGPLPEELMLRTIRPVSILWGKEDPWEDHDMARDLFGSLERVEEFVTRPGVGHCPQDEAPELVNPLTQRFVAGHAS